MEIRLKNLSKIFIDKTKKETRAVDDFNINFASEKLTGLLGPSGCGKSTMLFLIAGLHEPTYGRIFFGDDDVTRLSPDKRGIGLVFQNYALYPHMTVKQNIMFPLENMQVSREQALEETKKIAELVGIGTMLERKPAQLSGGQQQRVAIARALVKKPRVLLLDEPLSNLDARLRLQMREEIKRIQRETGITTIFVTHDQEEAMSISDEMVIMNFGKEMQKGAPQDIYLNPDNLFVAKFLGNPPINVFVGEIKKNHLYFQDKKIFKKKAPDGKYYVGIRPEDFRVATDEEGVVVSTDNMEVTGRDTTIHFMANDQRVRALVESDTIMGKKEVVLTVKEDRIHLFDMETELHLDNYLKLNEKEIEEAKELNRHLKELEEAHSQRKAREALASEEAEMEERRKARQAKREEKRAKRRAQKEEGDE